MIEWMTKKYLSIQVGSDCLMITLLTKSGNKLIVHHAGHMPLRDGIVRDGEVIQMDVLSAQLKYYLEKNNIVAKQVIFSIYHSRVITREVELPMLPQAKMQSLIEQNVQDYFPVDITGYLLGHRVQEVSAEGKIKKAKVQILAVPEKIITQYVSLCELLKLDMAGIDYQENSVLHFMQLQKLPNTHMLIHMDYESTTVAIEQEGKLAFAKTIPFGVSQFIQAVKDQYRVKTEEALRLLHEEQLLIQPEGEGASELAASTEFHMEEQNYLLTSIEHMLRSIEGYVKYYNTKVEAKPLEKIYLAGPGAPIRDMTVYIEERIGVETEHLKALKGITYQLKDAPEQTMYSGEVCIGATFFDFNVLPKQVRESRQSRERSRLMFLGSILIIVAFVSILIVPVVQLNMLKREEAALQQELKHYEYLQLFKEKYDSVYQEYDARMRLMQQVNTESNELLAFFETLEETIPTGITVQAITSTEAGIVLEVTAEDRLIAANFLTVLKDMECFEKVATNGLADLPSEDGETSAVQMSVTCTYGEGEV